MRGIELSKKCFYERFLPTLRERLPEAEGRIAAGLVGGGSECYGYDDEISRDHDFSDGFYIWLTNEDDLKYGVALSRIYRECTDAPSARSALPRERGVCTIEEFYMRYTGQRELPSGALEWLALSENALFEATNGEVFLDRVGEFSNMRHALISGMPEDVWRKKLAARLLTMAQAGQYNFSRCLAHGERGGARLALFEFARAAISAVFILNRAHEPYYKWSLRAMRGLSRLNSAADKIEALLGSADDALAIALIEEISADIIAELAASGLSLSGSDYLEPHAFEVYSSIKDRDLRAMHILEG